jgi:hypothetical protein
MGFFPCYSLPERADTGQRLLVQALKRFLISLQGCPHFTHILRAQRQQPGGSAEAVGKNRRLVQFAREAAASGFPALAPQSVQRAAENLSAVWELSGLGHGIAPLYCML